MRAQLEFAIDDREIGGVLDRFRQIVETTVAEQLKKVRSETAQAKATLPPSSPPAPAPEGTELPPEERLKARDLRTALLLGKIPEDAGILVDVKTAAKLLCVSAPTLYRLRDLKAMPQPVRLGSSVRWLLTELIEWVDEGCPSKWQRPASRTRRR
jgi:predicted DNA-binding transcriptional regulator AlpA